MKKVSVILTTHNSERTLQRAIDSIINQEGLWTNWALELLVVDDCSTDGTTELLDSMGIAYMKTDTISGGPNKARNIALMKASGDVITFIDHNDEWLPNKTIFQLEAIERAPIVSSGYLVKNDINGAEIKHFEEETKSHFYYKNETFLKKLTNSEKGQMTYLSSLMIHGDLRKHLFEESFGMVDFDWILQIFESKCSIEIPECLVVRHIEDRNISLSIDYRVKDYYYTLLTLESYENSYAKEVSEAIKALNGSRSGYFYMINQMDQSRRYFLKAGFQSKTIAYFFTSFSGSSVIKKHFNDFG